MTRSSRTASNPTCSGRSRVSRASLLAALITLASVGEAAAQEEQASATPYPASEIEQVVAPIALYPDSLLAQVFMASTYPMEVVEAARWREANPNLKDKALEDALKKQTWDPSVKSLTVFPQVLTMMNEKLDWTQKLGDIFLAQQKDVMDAVQRLRAKAKAEGNLETTEQQTVTEEPAPAGSSTTTIIQVEQANPQVVYVPTYNPTVVYGAWPYPAYPPYYYYPPGYVIGASMLSFGIGMAVGGALWGNCNWGGGDIDIDVNNNWNNNTNNNWNNNTNNNWNKNNNWNHNPEHRKGAGYRDQASQNKYGKGDRQKAASRDQFRGRAEQGRQQIGARGSQRGAAGRRSRRRSPGRRSGVRLAEAERRRRSRRSLESRRHSAIHGGSQPRLLRRQPRLARPLG